MTLRTSSPPDAALADRADRLLALHRPGDPLVLVNAWDAASARIVTTAGAAAVATSSAAVAASLGAPDDDCMDAELVFAAIRRTTAATPLPVTADIEAGYGLAADELVARLLDAGAVGCNLEDSDHARPGEQVAAGAFADRVASVRAAADTAGVHVVVNARIDTLLHGGTGPGALADVLDRGRRALEAGADCVYPIRLADPAIVAELVGALRGPVNVNTAPGATIADLAAAGASRISFGPRGFHAAMAGLEAFAAEALGRR